MGFIIILIIITRGMTSQVGVPKTTLGFNDFTRNVDKLIVTVNYRKRIHMRIRKVHKAKSGRVQV